MEQHTDTTVRDAWRGLPLNPHPIAWDSTEPHVIDPVPWNADGSRMVKEVSSARTRAYRAIVILLVVTLLVTGLYWLGARSEQPSKFSSLCACSIAASRAQSAS